MSLLSYPYREKPRTAQAQKTHDAVVLDAIGIHRSLRDVAIALWSFLLPSWFTVEEAWFAPKDGAELNDFRELQRKARLTWTIAAGAVGILIGATAPSGPSQTHTTYNPPISVPSKAGAG
jgi:formate-dependent nitrite reductase cytochrome c552 subunit